jgi:hypothetical protein
MEKTVARIMTKIFIYNSQQRRKDIHIFLYL